MPQLGLGSAGVGAFEGLRQLIADRQLAEKHKQDLASSQTLDTTRLTNAASQQDFAKAQLGNVALGNRRVDFEESQLGAEREQAAQTMAALQAFAEQLRDTNPADARTIDAMVAGVAPQLLGKIDVRTPDERQTVRDEELGFLAEKEALKPQPKPTYRFQEVSDPKTGESKLVRINTDTLAQEDVALGGEPGALTVSEKGKLEAQGVLTTLMGRVRDLSARINTSQEGLDAIMSGSLDKIEAMARENDDVGEYLSLVKAFASRVAKMGGESGRLTDQDIERFLGLFPNPLDNESLARRKINNLFVVVGLDPPYPDAYQFSGEQATTDGGSMTIGGYTVRVKER